ncbi:MAG TPA: SGNH/GDSL hydrolase family protein [Planctomycetota bacterium]|nr:SGNH/GDSL hydrolase family protein [Planctomycetota bacterium]
MGARTPRRRRIAAATAAALSALAAVEILLRLAEPFPFEPPLYPGDRVAIERAGELTVLDPDVGGRFAPLAQVEDRRPDFRVVYRCGEEGFRASLEPRAGDEERRVVFVGDSFTFGVGVEAGETFVERIAELHPGTRVFNYGMAGYGVDQMWRALARFGLPRRPDVVVALFVADDLSRSMTSYRYRQGWMAKPTFTLTGGRLVARDERNGPPQLWRWLEQRLWILELGRRASAKFGLERGFGDRFELNVALLDAMRADCEGIGARLVAVHLPQRGAWKPLPAFARALEERGIPVLDLGRLSPEDPGELFFPRDPHIDAGGHRFVAEALSHFLVEHGLLQEPRR